ncbi:GNAT family N-acetyltransferase [Terrimonas sp. NA20]|uniref:GNAT family N-acetyltransferase n=1 Tax=Terrimonas ginsenosidimutans TaxID=2908004 RepID=A0ABS9KUR2_9BACT|nr:GNAT family N-acetyltransferase [Terrimonas ginsenosidimutans]MCG2616071.1 GNAT family N-acetyltransferase [Terrimonas ginsenosidimutans]
MLRFRLAELNDADLYYRWSNEKQTRQNSYNQDVIPYESHIKWFEERIRSDDAYMYLFLNEQDIAIGQVRIERSKGPDAGMAVIGLSVDSEQRGKAYSAEMLQIATADFLSKNAGYSIHAYVFVSNEASYKSFLRAGYKLIEKKLEKGILSYILEKKS